MVRFLDLLPTRSAWPDVALVTSAAGGIGRGRGAAHVNVIAAIGYE